MSCFCSAELTRLELASTAIKDATLAVEAATIGVSDAILADTLSRETHNMEVGLGLSDIATSMTTCCDAWAAAGGGTFEIPATTNEVTCPDGSTITCGTPAVTATTTSWGGTQMYAAAARQQSANQASQLYNEAQMFAATAQQQSANQASQLYNDQYNAWLASYESWRTLQIIPQIGALVANVAAATLMYNEWQKYLEKTNDLVCAVADDALPQSMADFSANNGKYSEHVDTLSANFTEHLGALEDRRDWHCIKADDLCACYFEDGVTGAGAGYAILEKQHAQNMAQNMSNIATEAQAAAQNLGDLIAEHQAGSAQSYGAWREGSFEGITDQVAGLYDKAVGICDYLNTCGKELVDGYNNGIADDVRAYLEDQVADGTACLPQIQAAIAQANGFLAEQDALYAAYNASETTFAPEVIDGAATLLQSQDLALNTHDWLEECAQNFKDKYDLGVGVNEDVLAAKILELACRLSVTQEESVTFKTDLADECLEHWQDNYAGCDAILGAGVMEEAKLLMSERKSTFDTLIANHEAFYDCWLTHYKPLEHEYSQAAITKATELVGTLCTNIDNLCVEADDFLAKWKSVWQAAECATSLKIIEAGITGCEQQIDSYEGLDEMFDKLFDKWFNEICEHDLTDIQRACAIWDKADPTCELLDNSDCAQDIVDAAKNCYLTLGLQCEKEYIQELCSLPEYQAKYCQLEDRAFLHIRRRFDIARENLMRAGTRYCAEDIKEQLCKLEAEQTRQEAAAMMAANRFERWWEVQESDRRHRYKVDMIAAIQQLPTTAYAGLQVSDQALDSILTQVHNRLNRSYNYLSLANSAGNAAAGSAAQGVNQALNSVQLGHYWTDHSLALKREADTQAAQLVLRGQEQTRIGHTYMTQGLNALGGAETTSRGAVQDGLNVMTHGRQFKQLALSASNAESADINAVENLALGHIDRGHFLVQEARSYRGQAWQAATDAVAQAQGQVQAGHDTLNQMLAFEQQRDNLIRMCRDNGMDAAAHGLQMMQAGSAKVDRAMSAAEGGLNHAVSLLQVAQNQDSQWLSAYHNLAALGSTASGAYTGVVNSGHNALSLGINAGSIGQQQKAAMCQKICEEVRNRNVTLYQQLSSFNNTAAQAAQLSQQFGSGLANSIDGVIGSVQGLTGAPPTLIQPGGQNLTNAVIGNGISAPTPAGFFVGDI